MTIKISKNQVVATINPKVYPLEAIYGAAYVFLDRAYVFLDEDSKGQILVSLKGKDKMSKKALEALKGDFYNELLNYSLRYQISKDNKKIREYIVARALIGALGEDNLEQEESNQDEGDEGEEIEEVEEWKGDTLGISTPWEEKYSSQAKTVSKAKKKTEKKRKKK